MKNLELWAWKDNGSSLERLSLSGLARKLDCLTLANLLDEWVNLGGKEFEEGIEIGLILAKSHRTIQRLIIRLALGIICGLSKQERTDARNEDAIATARKINTMVENGELGCGWFI